MSEWKECKLGDVCEFQEGYVNPSQNFSEYFDGNIKWLRATDLNNGNVYNTSRTLTEKGFLSAGKSAKLFKPNTIGISKSGTIGRLGILKDYMCGNRAVINIAPSEKVNTQFIYYSLLNRQEQFEHLAVGSVQKNLYVPILAELKIKLPSISKQNEIVKVLSSFDDKIELNNQINRNLEEQAQALFKSWFIDFEPFGGKMPCDWEIGKLGDFVEIKRGGSPRPIQEFLSDSGYRWLKISDVTALNSPFILQIAEHIKESGLNKTVFLKAGSLVLSNSATPGIPKILDLDSCIHDGWLYFPKSKLSNEFLYLFFKDIRKDLVNLGNGSIFTNLKTEILKNFDTALPSQKVLDDFQKIVEPLFKQMLNIQRENQSLSTLRDSLLPKFMSGEISLGC